MPDREKVIKGLEWCMNEKHDCYREKGCPYENEGDDIGCEYALHRDALALLKAQDVMVMAGAELTDAELIEEIRKAPFVLKPNVDAIPVEWLREQCKVFDSMARGGHHSAWIIKALILQWQNEQEAQDG